MISQTSSNSSDDSEGTAHAPEGQALPAALRRNGQALTPPSPDQTAEKAPAAADAGKTPSTVERAEALVGQLEAKVGPLGAWLADRMRTWSAHVREAVEDFWAEAQDIRKGKDKGA
jgi:hypothetical protein